MLSMGRSPLHGIFQAFSQDRGTLPSSPLEESTKSSLPSSIIGQVALDIYEQDSYYIIKVPLAGVHVSDIDIEVSDNVVTLRGTRRQSDVIPEDHYLLQECFWGEFSRSVTLPCSIDPRRVKATFNKEGVLKVLIPKEERVKIVRVNAE